MLPSLSSMQSFSVEHYQIGIISALPKELTAVIAILDEEHQPLRPKDLHDNNNYVLGQISEHKVVAACQPVGVYGTTTAALVCKDMLRTFPQLRFGLFVGIGGGIPNIKTGRDIRLGDVVVSQPDQIHGGVVQYDIGKRLSDGRFKRGRDLNRPPTTLLTALSTLQSRRGLDDSPIPGYLDAIDRKHPSLKKHGYYFQGHDRDHLCCTRCDPSQWWWTLWLLVLWVWPLWRCQNCDDDNGRVRRPPRTHNDPVVHYGTIASGNTLLENAQIRDQLRDDLGALCVEMEAAGVVEEFPCLVVRGICDYADAQRNDLWQEYAALTAAAFAKQLLGYTSLQATKQEKTILEVLNKLEQHLQRQEAHNIRQEAYQQSQEAFNQRQETRYQDERHRDCHSIFDTSKSCDGGYENHKNINPDAIPGTCRWVLDHHQYRDWLASSQDDLLWISADPGCGKSVLSKSLIDTHLRDTKHESLPTICYFFFKDNEQQDKLSIALCAIIHQLFSQQPDLIRSALPAFDESGEKLQHKVNDLWRILLSAASSAQVGPIICVLDALDECRDVDRRQLIDFLCQFHSNSRSESSKHNTLKWLVTSRPYDDLRERFDKIPATLPSIRLTGEDESDQIKSEINLVIQERVRGLSHELQLSTEKTEEVAETLLKMEHRTYLWLYLAIDAIKKTFRDALRPADKVIPLVPASVEEAYEKILSRIANTQKVYATTVLTIIVGARRPLTVGEMAIALDIARLPEPPVSSADLSIDAKQLGDSIRRWCGLFVLISGQRLYLIHQTAKEFLLRLNDGPVNIQGRWKDCLCPLEVEKDMATVCIRFLCLSDFDNDDISPDSSSVSFGDLSYDSTQDRKVKSSWQTFFDFAAEHWGDYVRPIEQHLDETTRTAMEVLYDPHSSRFARLKRVMMWTATSYPYILLTPSNVNLAAYHGHKLSLKSLIRASGDKTDFLNNEGSTALNVASQRGFLDVVKMLLDSGADVNAADEDGSTSLFNASADGHLEIVQALLKCGADVDAACKDGRTSLLQASLEGHLEIVQALLKYGADVNAADEDGYTSLLQASTEGHLEIVQALLKYGADVNAAIKYGSTSLFHASTEGHLEIIQTLLKNGADVNAVGLGGHSSLTTASAEGHLGVVQALLDKGADVNSQCSGFGTALEVASLRGHEAIVQLLLSRGARLPGE